MSDECNPFSPHIWWVQLSFLFSILNPFILHEFKSFIPRPWWTQLIYPLSLAILTHAFLVCDIFTHHSLCLGKFRLISLSSLWAPILGAGLLNSFSLHGWRHISKACSYLQTHSFTPHGWWVTLRYDLLWAIACSTHFIHAQWVMCDPFWCPACPTRSFLMQVVRWDPFWRLAHSCLMLDELLRPILTPCSFH